jgi:signal transduction histidine kinase
MECQPDRLNQVFMNILSNAIQAIDEKGEIFIKTVSEGASVSITIRDSGKGMDEEVQKRIFEPFYTTKDMGKGTGLGLSISYSIVEQHNGKINMSSELSKGTEFIITLPVQQKSSNV